MTARLVVRSLSIEIDACNLLRDVSLLVSPGEVLALLGANGAGKSTLLAALAGEIKPASGSIDLDGLPLASYSLHSLAEKRAINSVEPMPAFALSVSDIVALGRPFQSVDEHALRSAMTEMQVMRWATRDVVTLSSGEYLRVQLARSRYQLGDSRECVWLLDEPCAHLDLAQRQFVLQRLRHIASTLGWSIIFSTHDPAEAEAIADQVILMRGGAVIARGAPAVALSAESLSRCYGTDVSRRSAWVAR
jgi:iron complex transport system ATP-binding protein